MTAGVCCGSKQCKSTLVRIGMIITIKDCPMELPQLAPSTPEHGCCGCGCGHQHQQAQSHRTRARRRRRGCHRSHGRGQAQTGQRRQHLVAGDGGWEPACPAVVGGGLDTVLDSESPVRNNKGVMVWWGAGGRPGVGMSGRAAAHLELGGQVMLGGHEETGGARRHNAAMHAGGISKGGGVALVVEKERHVTLVRQVKGPRQVRVGPGHRKLAQLPGVSCVRFYGRIASRGRGIAVALRQRQQHAPQCRWSCPYGRCGPLLCVDPSATSAPPVACPAAAAVRSSRVNLYNRMIATT